MVERWSDVPGASVGTATFLLGLLISTALTAVAGDCFCQFPEGGNSSVPLWVCAGGYRQYSCLDKVTQGVRQVLRGREGDQRSDASYCSRSRAPEPCVEVAPAGFSLHAGKGKWRARANQIVEVTCPSDLNCTAALGYLAPSCAEGPFPNESSLEFRFIASEAYVAIPSPTSNGDVTYAPPFGYEVAFAGDTFMVGDPTYKKIWMFHPPVGDAAWDTTPAVTFTHPLLFTAPPGASLVVNVKLSNTAIIVGKWTKDALPESASAAEVDAWVAMPQRVYVFTRGPDGSWDFTVDAVVFEATTNYALASGYQGEPAGFGFDVGISDNYAIVSSKHRTARASASGLVFIYERVGGAWGTTPVLEIEGYTATGFGTIVEVSDGDGVAEGIALVASPAAGSVHVFERNSGAWSDVATSTLASVKPAVMALSGSYFIVGDSATHDAKLYERGAGGALYPAWGLKFTFELDASQPLVGQKALFGSAVAVDDRGGGLATAVVGGHASRRAVVFFRRPTDGVWAADPDGRQELFVNQGVVNNSDGFGRSVAVRGDNVVVGSDAKHVYIFTEQLVGAIFATPAVPFEGEGPLHQLVFDFRLISTAIDYKLCIDLDGEGDDEVFKDVGLPRISIPPESGPRLQRTEEL